MRLGPHTGPIRGKPSCGIRDDRGGPVGVFDFGTIPGVGAVQLEVQDLDWLDRWLTECSILRHRLQCARTGRTA